MVVEPESYLWPFDFKEEMMTSRMTVVELERRLDGAIHELREVEQILGAALDYPRYFDDPLNFPDAMEEDGVCVGEMTVAALAEQITSRIATYEAERKNKIFIPVELRGCLLATVQKQRHFLSGILEGIVFEFKDSFDPKIRQELDGWIVEIAEYDAILEAIRDKETSGKV